MKSQVQKRTLKSFAIFFSISILFCILQCNNSGKHSSLIFHEDFEEKKFDSFIISRSENTPGPTIADDIMRSGKYAGKSQVIRADEGAPFNYRCELVPARHKYIFIKEPIYAKIGKEYWYGFSIHLPGNWIITDEAEMLAQWHGKRDVGEGFRNPPLGLRIRKDFYELELASDADFITFTKGEKIDNCKYDRRELVPIGSIEQDLGKWTDWVFHIKWDYNKSGNGLTEIWKNGKKIFHSSSPNCFYDKLGPYLKFGVYRWTWKYPRKVRPSKIDNRIIFYDEIRIGNSKASYSDITLTKQREDKSGFEDSGMIIMPKIDFSNGTNEIYQIHCSSHTAPFDGSDPLCNDLSLCGKVWVYLWPDTGVCYVEFNLDEVRQYRDVLIPWELFGGSPLTKTGDYSLKTVVTLKNGREETLPKVNFTIVEKVSKKP